MRTGNPVVRGSASNVLLIDSISSATQASNPGSPQIATIAQRRKSSTQFLRFSNDVSSKESTFIDETDIAVETRQTPAKPNIDVLVNRPNKVALTNNESSKKSNSINKSNTTVQARITPTKPSIDKNNVTLSNNQASKDSSSMNVSSSNKGNTLVSNLSTLHYDGPSTSTGYYSTTNNLPPIPFRTIYSSDESITDSD